MLPFFRPRQPPERLASSFRWLERKILPTADEPGYAARYELGAYRLELLKESFFAWETLRSERTFGDIVLEADVEIDPSNGHSAAGVILRHVNDENFYFLLMSTRGNFRFDLLFNNHPQHLIEWTRLPEPDGPTRRLQVIAHGSHFSFIVDDEWVGEADDEVLPAGGIGFAAQNFAGAGPGAFRLRRLAVDARALEVERAHLRWTYYFPVSPTARARLAETLFGMGSFSAAVVQLRKALKDRPGTAREHLLLAESYARLSMYTEALAELDAVLTAEPGNREARLEKPNVLYLANRLLEARDALTAVLADPSLEPGPATWNLLGNTEYALGNWPRATEAYLRAVDMQPDMALFLSNAGRSLEKEGKGPQAVEMYLRAARVLFASETFDELSLLLPRLAALDARNQEARSIEGRVLYQEGRLDDAERIFRALVEEGAADSSVSYLLGIILGGKGRREEALPYLEKAAQAEPSFPLYQFRLAETLHLLGRDAGPVLERALALAPDDPWTNNLAGMIRLEARDPAAAIGLLQKAAAAAPTEIDIAINLSEALAAAGRQQEALAGLDAWREPDARIANQKGNIKARAGDNAGAAAAYEEAVRLDPENPVYKENCAAACIEIDMVHRAEELLAQVEESNPSPSVYNLLGNVAVLKGELARAELAFNAGLERDPGNPELLVNLAMLHLQRNAYEKAKEILEAVLARNPAHARARRVLERARAQRETVLSCATCGRQWWVPRDLPSQPGIKVRGEPPADAPAGRCPRCGKIYCVGCASAHTREMRFYCPECDEYLKLSEDSLKWLLARSIEQAAP